MISPWMTPSQQRRATHAARKKVAREREAAKRKDGGGFERVVGDSRGNMRRHILELELDIHEASEKWFRTAKLVWPHQ